MHKGVKNEGKAIQFCLNMFEYMSLVILFGMGITVGLEPLFEGHDHHQYIDTVIHLTAGTYLAVQLRKRKRGEKQFDDSMIGDLDRAIFQVEVQNQRYRMFPWIVLGPMVLLAIAKHPMYYDSKPLWLTPTAVLCLLVTIGILRHELKNKQEPRLKALKELREKLAKP